MTTVTSRWHNLLRSKLDDEIEKSVGALGEGVAADYPAYREQVGRIRGLRDALKIAGNTDTEMQS